MNDIKAAIRVAVMTVCAVTSLNAQSIVADGADGAAPTPPGQEIAWPVSPALDLTSAFQQPAGPPPTPRHTGFKAMARELVTDVKLLPSKENLIWASVGGGLALAVHPADDNVNEALVGNETAEKIFKAGAVLGQFGTLFATSSGIYAFGRLKDQPRVSHVGMDLIRALLISEGITQTLKYTVRRERPDGSGPTSFPSGHAADTFAFATALERHLGWRYAVPAYTLASYVAISRLPANRHWFSDAVFGSAVGIIAGRTVTAASGDRYPVTVVPLNGGLGVFFIRGGD